MIPRWISDTSEPEDEGVERHLLPRVNRRNSAMIRLAGGEGFH